MAPLKVGDKFPENVQFDWVPITDDDPTICGRPQPFNASKEWKGKKIVLFAVPGAFTPGCQANHLPPYIQKLDQIKAKGVDQLAVIAFNDAWVMNAWAKVNKVKGEDLLFLGDSKDFAKAHGWSTDSGRSQRWAMIIEKDGTVSYSEVEPEPGVTVSGAEAVLSKL